MHARTTLAVRVARATTLLTCLALLACGQGVTGAGRAHGAAAGALAPVDVARELRGVPLGRHVALLEDRERTLSVEDLLRPMQSERFSPGSEDSPSLGFTASAYWLRLPVVNTAAVERAWLLELAYPLLDRVTLYIQRADGSFEGRATGDMLPFSRRDIAYRNFAFSLREPAHSARTYYVRVATDGVLKLPLVGWSTRQFLEHQHLDWAALCIFYGVILVMACYNAGVWAVTKQSEYLPYVAYIVSFALLQFTLAGHTQQFLLPDAPMLVHRALLAVVALTLLFATLVVVQTYLPSGHRLHRLKHVIVVSCLLFACAGFVLPMPLMYKLVHIGVLAVMAAAFSAAVALMRLEGNRAKLFMIGWGSMIAGAAVAAMLPLGWMPQSFLTEWAVQIGASVQLVLVSSALADKLNKARNDLGTVHGTLHTKLAQLSLALERAEEASERARRATRVKDDFMATMSHEFRTPLNPIINIPQQMRSEFVEGRVASCETCSSHFELDEAERVDASTACPECARTGCLVESRGLRYVGDPSRSRRFLLKVERSGRHLLEVVNGILDFSKLEAGHREVVREPVELLSMVEEVVAPLRSRAAEQGLTITCALGPDELELDIDGPLIRQVLGKLLDNAIKYSNDPGLITLAGEVTRRGFTFAVTDTGVGIAREHHERIFRSFEQVHRGTTRRYGGTGLGLSIARSIVRMHGGELTVESELGQGATFRFDLPGELRVRTRPSPRGSLARSG